MLNQIKTVALLGLLSALLTTISYGVIGGTGGAIIGIILTAAMNFSAWYYSDKIALAAYGARPVTASRSPKIYSMVERLCQRAGLPVPAVYAIATPAANAFATGRDPEHAAIAFTDGILNLLSDDELEGVIAHELSHIQNRDTLTQAVAATVAGAISLLAQMASNAMWFGVGGGDRSDRNPFGLILTVILAPIAATAIQLAISRTREFSADTSAAKLTGNPRALANALQRLETSARQTPIQSNPAFAPLLIVNLSGEDWYRSLFSTHPPTQARIKNLLKLEQ
jgi:heat shock protein HtpX